jgi:hypothetical protein
VNLASLDGFGPAEFTKSQREPGVGVELDNVWRGAASVGHTLDALNRTEGRHSNLDCVTGAKKGELFEKVANRGRFLCFVAGAKKRDGLAAVLGFYSSAWHGSILTAFTQQRLFDYRNDKREDASG